MKLKYLLLFILFCFISRSLGQDIFDEIDSTFSDFEQEQDEEWNRFVSEVEQIWGEFERSTEKKWVDYGQNKKAKSKIEFEKGKVEIKAIAENDSPKELANARKNLTNQIKKILSDDNESKTNVLENQVKFRDGRLVTKENVKNFIESEILSKLFKSDETITGKDGKKRYILKATLPIVKNHVLVRAKKYLPIVLKYAEKYLLDPKFVLAIIYTESAFNPLAKSWANAYGLMQLVPRFGGLESFEFVFGYKKKPTPSYLFQPEKNIELGTAYFYLIFNKHFKDVPESRKKVYMAAASYNWGPHRVRKYIINKYNAKNLSDDEVYQIIRYRSPNVPTETQNYIERVTKRMPLFNVFFE